MCIISDYTEKSTLFCEHKAVYQDICHYAQKTSALFHRCYGFDCFKKSWSIIKIHITDTIDLIITNCNDLLPAKPMPYAQKIYIY